MTGPLAGPSDSSVMNTTISCPGAECLFHKVKGGFQGTAGLGRSGFPLLHLVGEGLLHQAEGVLSGEERFIGQQGGILFQPGLCLLVQLCVGGGGKVGLLLLVKAGLSGGDLCPKQSGRGFLSVYQRRAQAL